MEKIVLAIAALTFFTSATVLGQAPPSPTANTPVSTHEPIKNPLGRTGHFSCDSFFVRKL